VHISTYQNVLEGFSGLVVKASGWNSFDYISSNPNSARVCGVAWDAVPKPRVKHIDPDFDGVDDAVELAVCYYIHKNDTGNTD
jgi:hypothetical protein